MEGRLLGNYRLGTELGSGGMGTVYLASVEKETEGLEIGDRVAMKVVHPHLVARPEFVERFHREGLIGRRIRHPNVVRTLEVGEAEGEDHPTNYIVMEYVEGRTLRGLLDDLGTVPEALLREIAAQIAAGLEAIHEAGIVHRDLKPENFLITDSHRVRIMDLGVARLVAESVRLTQEGHFAGSLYYAAPEQFRIDRVGPPADLYSVGVLLHEMATGENPFRRDDAAAIVHAHLATIPPRLSDRVGGVSGFFSEVVANLLEKEPEARFESAGRLEKILRSGEASTWWGKREQTLLRATGNLPRIPTPRETGLYGRDEQLTALREAWASARRGEGRSLLLDGEAGIGKTRLVDAFLRELEREDAHLLYGSYPPSGGIGGISGALVAKFGRSRLAESLRPYLTATPALVPAFAAMVKNETPPEGLQFLDGEAVHSVLCQLMREMAEEKPVCWAVDDLHFAKPDSRQLLLSLARALEGRRVLLLLTFRTGLPEDEIAFFSGLSTCRRVHLGRLSPREVIELLQDAFGSDALAEKLGGKIAYKSDGVPYFVFEMIRGLKEGRFLETLPDGTFIETQAVQEIQVPSAVRDLIEGRLGDLTKEERAILDVGTVQGFEFDADLTARVLERRRVAVLQDLAEIGRRTGVVRSEGPGYRFDHHQIQEVIYEDLSEGLRREYHSMVADALIDREGLGDVRAEKMEGETAVLLASHHLRGSRPHAAVAWITRALGHLSDAYRSESAIELADLALSQPGLLEGDLRADVLLVEINLLDLLGRREKERKLLDEVFELADESKDLGRRARFRRLLGWHLGRVSDMAEAEQRVREALAIAQVAGDREEEAKSASVLGNLLRRLGRSEEAEVCHRDSLRISRETGDRGSELAAKLGLGSVCWSRGSFEDARIRYEEVLGLAREIGDQRNQAIAMGNLGLVMANLGLHEQARRHNEEALGILRLIGDRRNEGAFTGNLGLVLAQLGRYEDALARHERSRAISREIGDRHGEGISRINLGQLYTALGDFEKAREALDGLVEWFEEMGAPQPLGYAIQALAEVAEHTGEKEEAIRLYRDAVQRLRAVADPVGQASSLICLGALLVEDGGSEEARRCLEEARAPSEESGAHDEVVLATCLLARLPGGDPARAEAELEEREEHLRQSAKMRARWILYQATGDAPHLEAARRLLGELRDHAPDEYRKTMIEKVPLHREIMAAGV